MEALEAEAQVEAVAAESKEHPGVPEDRVQRNFTDTQSLITPGPGGRDFLQACNCPAVVDREQLVIAAARATHLTSDKQRGLVMITDTIDGGGSLTSVAFGMLFVVGPVEETCKFLAVRLGAYRSPYFDEPGDALVYSAAAPVASGAIWGNALGEQVRTGRRRARPTPAGIAGGAIAHGCFNIAVFASFPVAVFLVLSGISWTVGRFAWTRRSSPFRSRRNYPQIKCLNCGREITIISHRCLCGVPVPGGPTRIGDLICSNCSHHNRGDARYCIRCGDRRLR